MLKTHEQAYHLQAISNFKRHSKLHSMFACQSLVRCIFLFGLLIKINGTKAQDLQGRWVGTATGVQGWGHKEQNVDFFFSAINDTVLKGVCKFSSLDKANDYKIYTFNAKIDAKNKALSFKLDSLVEGSPDFLDESRYTSIRELQYPMIVRLNYKDNQQLVGLSYYYRTGITADKISLYKQAAK